MKKVLFACFFIWSINAFSQCKECNSLDEALKAPEKVKMLSVNSWMNQVMLDSLPSSIGQLVNAEIIYLSDHNISSIPKEIGNLVKLKELSFAGCKLTQLPDEIFC